jgi:hypothetical protein
MESTGKWGNGFSRNLFLVGMSVLCALGLVVMGCDDDKNGGGGGDPITSDLYGTYSVTSPSEAVGHTIIVGDDTWSMSGRVVNSSGSYTLSSDQRTATLRADDVSGTVGTVYIKGAILTGILNSASGYPGTYTATKN